MGLMMTFTPTQKELFNKNIEALSNILLKESLKQIQSSKFELILGKDNLDINLKDTSDNTFLYENVIDELNTMLNTYNDKYLLYPVLYFYGFGNGVLFKALLQNKNHQHIVVFEKDIEIIWIMFHVLDFSNELQNSRLMILQTSSLDIELFSNFCSSKPFFQFSRIYFLELMSHYYERFHEDVLELNKKLVQDFKDSILSHGNDPLDALQGIEQFVYNLPQMITHPSYKELLSKRKNLSDTAIIVSTGPSLTKQLPLLKKYANKATIFCADSSYPILAKHGIKPDYVCMLERDEIVAECFNNDFGEFDKDIVFIVKSVTHPHTIKYLQKNNRAFILVSTYASFIQYLKLDYFGYFNMGFSVAHMNFLLTIHLKYKNIILIGQDLAYAKDGQTHSQGFIHANLHNGDYERDLDKFSTTAYGGNGKVQSSEIWTLFRHNFEKDIVNIKMNYHITTYNCTEGGARIEGTIEKPFLWACENLLHKDLNKPFEKLEPLSLNKQNEFLLKAYYKVYQSIKHCRDFSNKFIKSYNKIKNSFMSLQNSQENETLIKEIIKDIDKIKTQIDELYNTQKDLMQILGPLLTQFELNLARIYVLNPKTKEDAFNKSILWIKEHLEFMELVYGHIKAQENALIKNILPLEEKLKERKLDKWMERVRR
ncbi:TPA: motility associated factor glycosyltransferase family protein [Campylobacter jejuni]|uniref:motility associated factor glycosyltransferase family protein n=2 Tax=Campylobacter jejuni TaxID=197 RepID=UPI0009A7ECF5|nr:motility associated factor glycosyltransferase family protein [Campylobacter jejuni]EAK7832391.1 motility associated factor glycosyltransferase family protein [Campylobacter jejuni]HED4782601.1 motility associated factor glycosyltransferase family protein [Campylobacter jejuni]HED8529948.1 motility associated factor glycosyltransferase family protein [Campylobacter jejuni]HEG5461883.1 motility associated factor glycosyltransferase family protein [Campylobacter jejuni]HEG6010156.1 motility a